MKNVLIDTDVILDVFFDRKPQSDNATRILSLCEQKELNGFVTPVIISNLYYLLRKTASHSRVIEKLKQLISIVDILHMDREVVTDALNSNFKDFEDALQNFAAISFNSIDVIITRNVKDYKKSEVGVLAPGNFIDSYYFDYNK